MDKDTIVVTLQGYARANERIEAERGARLATLTPVEARAISQDLQASWEAVAHSEDGLERLDLWQVESLLIMRRAFEPPARAKA